jgi:hypothetical protein
MLEFISTLSVFPQVYDQHLQELLVEHLCMHCRVCVCMDGVAPQLTHGIVSLQAVCCDLFCIFSLQHPGHPCMLFASRTPLHVVCIQDTLACVVCRCII